MLGMSVPKVYIIPVIHWFFPLLCMLVVDFWYKSTSTGFWCRVKAKYNTTKGKNNKKNGTGSIYVHGTAHTEKKQACVSVKIQQRQDGRRLYTQMGNHFH